MRCSSNSTRIIDIEEFVPRASIAPGRGHQEETRQPEGSVMNTHCCAFLRHGRFSESRADPRSRLESPRAPTL